MSDLYTGIIDLAHMDKDVLATEAANNGIGAVILKVCTGVGCPDSAFNSRFSEALSLNLLVSGYSFLTGAHSGAEQWTDFKKYWDTACATHGINPKSIVVWADFENNPSGSKATPQIAKDYLEAGKADGYRVGIYCGESNGVASFPSESDTIGTFPLWLAAYGPDPRTEHVPPPWRDVGWKMAQYTNGGAGPSDQTTFPRSGTDRSCFLGTFADLAAWWKGQA